MEITKLIVRQFRSYSEAEFIFQPGLNIIVGNNATGKTNILEAICFLSMVYSPRTHAPRTLIRHGGSALLLEGYFTDQMPHNITVKLTISGRKELIIDGKRSSRQSDVMGRMPVVWFAPEDLQLIKGEPEHRRRWVNMVLCQLYPQYQEELRRCHKSLMERNAALRRIIEGRARREELEAWDIPFARSAAHIMHTRAVFLGEIEPLFAAFYSRMSNHAEQGTLFYQPSVPVQSNVDNVCADIIHILQERRSAELMMGATLVGPHRDDISCMLNGTSARLYASQGQQRSMVLALKLAEISYIKSQRRHAPIGLFDDVLSELDDDRSEHFWDIVLTEDHDMQCLLTSVSLPKTKTMHNAPYQVIRTSPYMAIADTATS